MPIYAYRCSSCGLQKDHLQKMSDPALTECPECGKSTYGKMLTAPQFQLKGSGWYVTDFRNGSKPAAADGKSVSSAGGDAKGDSASDGGSKAPSTDSSSKDSSSKGSSSKDSSSKDSSSGSSSSSAAPAASAG
jgi:putative FmdB family regulatory protein